MQKSAVGGKKGDIQTEQELQLKVHSRMFISPCAPTLLTRTLDLLVVQQQRESGCFSASLSSLGVAEVIGERWL